MNETEQRPWGSYQVLYEEAGMKVKRIIVNPGHRLSLQSHKQRSENWIILQGTARVVLDQRRILLNPNQTVFIPKKAVHRIGNTGTEPVIFIEVQRGDYLGEDDIVRYEDDYRRV